MTIDLTPLKKALASLEDILAQKKNKYIRSGVIKEFEIVFELSWKLMQRVLKLKGVESGSPMQVFRAAQTEKVIENFDYWAGLLKERNLTVHTYNDKTAEEVYKAAQSFPPHVRKLLQVLEKEISLLK